MSLVVVVVVAAAAVVVVVVVAGLVVGLVVGIAAGVVDAVGIVDANHLSHMLPQICGFLDLTLSLASFSLSPVCFLLLLCTLSVSEPRVFVIKIW